MEFNKNAKIFLGIASMMVIASGMFLAVSMQFISNQNDIAIFQAELQKVYNTTLEGTDVSVLIPLNNIGVKRFSYLSAGCWALAMLLVLLTLIPKSKKINKLGKSKINVKDKKYSFNQHHSLVFMGVISGFIAGLIFAIYNSLEGQGKLLKLIICTLGTFILYYLFVLFLTYPLCRYLNKKV